MVPKFRNPEAEPKNSNNNNNNTWPGTAEKGVLIGPEGKDAIDCLGSQDYLEKKP